MLDPFLNYPSSELNKESNAFTEQQIAQHYGYSIKDTRAPGPLARWIGNFMIRIGKNLAGDELPANSAKRAA